MADGWERTRLDHRSRQADAIARSALALVVEHGASSLTMAGVAAAAGVSRQTLYRYFPDLDAVLTGIAELIATHDQQLTAEVVQQPDPAAQLEVIVGAVIDAGGHDADNLAAARAALPPRAREVLSGHEARIHQLLADVLTAGVDRGVFRHDLEPSTDAPLLLGLAAAARPGDAERARTLIHRLIDHRPQEQPT